MVQGYQKPLYILPFDHRASYEKGLFGWQEPLNEEQTAKVAESKQVIYEGFKHASADKVAKEKVGILVDEQFGAEILRDAHKNGFITAYSTEKSGQEEFDFAYGDDFPRHIEEFDPTFAKVLVRYNPEGDAAMNERQVERLQRLSKYLEQSNRLFMFELLIPPEKMQLERFDGDKDRYDLQLRPQLLFKTLQILQDAGIEPDVWKIEGLDRREDCEQAVKIAKRAGRNSVGLIVLGRGADEQHVVKWLQTASSVPGFIGFAVGRTTFWTPIVDYEAKKLTAEEAANKIAKNFEEWIETFEKARQ
jgi:myo-inositol catabolism protein IolC